MTSAKRTVGIGLSTCGLLLGLLCLGRAVETALNKDLNRLNQSKTVTAGLLLGIPTTVGALWILKDSERSLKLTQSQRLQSLFYKALKANNGRINAIQFAMLGQVSLAEAQTCLDAWAGLLNADFQVDESGIVMYCFPLAE
ncbi:MAG: hypothetical protein WBB01_08715 [Phormidesmis sp.]